MTLYDVETLKREAGDEMFLAQNDSEIIEVGQMFPTEEWDCPEAYAFAGIKGYEPMTAKELDTEEKQDEALSDSQYYLEEKFDGTRALVYFISQNDVDGNELGYCRVFSRRVSKKTNFYVENSDSLPHIRDNDVPDLAGTILDGEMFINGLPFKEVSSTLNCLWDKAVERQIEKGFISFHAFDILFYKGIDLRKMTLERRKVYLKLAVEEADNEYIELVVHNECGKSVDTTPYIKLHGSVDTVYKKLEKTGRLEAYPNFSASYKKGSPLLSPRAFYEYIVATDGEGLIIKPKNGKYNHKRGWEYSKIKKFLTRDLIVIGFDEPTKEYTGKDVRKWGFWERKSDKAKVLGNFFGDKNYEPVTKYYYYNQVGTMKLGVLITKDEYESIPKNKRGEVFSVSEVCDWLEDEDTLVMTVCDCSGYDDDTREYFTRNREKMVGSVVEVKANDLFKDSGKMRHPRFLRVRHDKEADRCIWEDHIM